MKHIILAGDSVFDNASYVNSGEPDVATQVREIINDGDKVTLLAVDGHITEDVGNQLQRLPEDATHLFISVGGNDALGNLHLFDRSVSKIGDAFDKFYEVMKDFEEGYIRMLVSAMKYGLKTTVCTIYHPCFTHTNLKRVAEDNYFSYENNINLQKINFLLNKINK